MLNKILEIIGTATGIIGALAISLGKPWGFWCWMVGNPAWIWFGLRNKHYWLAIQFAVYTVITAIGIYTWATQGIGD